MSNPVPQLTAADKAIRNLRNPAAFRGWAAAFFTGAFNASTAFAASRFPGNQLDIFAEAAAAPKGWKDIRNNWLGQDRKPIFDVYPKAIGVHIGDFGVDTEKVASIIAERSQLIVEQEAQVILRQPVLSLPAGMGIDRSIATTSTDSTKYAERVGPVTPTGLFQLPDNVVFEKGKALRAYLEISEEGLTYLRAIATNIPARGGIIGVAVHGIAEYELGTNR